MDIKENIFQKNEDLFKNILKDLSLKAFNNEALKDVVNSLDSIYKSGFQHKHSDIAIVILQCKGKIDEASMFLAENFRNIEFIIQECPDENIKEKIWRLSDHVNLECIHFQSIEQAEKDVKELNLQIEREKQVVKKIGNQAQKVEKQIENQQNQHTIILGIFASIVLTTISELVFTTSVLSNIDKSSIYRLIFMISLIALFIFNTLSCLFRFISGFNENYENNIKKKLSYIQRFTYFNIIIFVIIVFDGLAWCIIEKRQVLSDFIARSFMYFCNQ